MSSPERWTDEATLAPVPHRTFVARDFVSSCLDEHELGYLVRDVCQAVEPFLVAADRSGAAPVILRLERLPFCVGLSVRARRSSDDPGGAVPLDDAERALLTRLSSSWGESPGAGERQELWALFATVPTRMTMVTATAAASR